MKLIRFGNPGEEKPGLELADGKWIDASAFGEDYTAEFFDNDGLARLQTWADANAAKHGRTRAARQAEEERAAKAARELDAHRRDDD